MSSLTYGHLRQQTTILHVPVTILAQAIWGHGEFLCRIPSFLLAVFSSRMSASASSFSVVFVSPGRRAHFTAAESVAIAIQTGVHQRRPLALLTALGRAILAAIAMQ